MIESRQSQTGFLPVEGARLFYEVAGQGHPLVMVHAGVADHTMWDGQFAEFARKYRVIRYDTRAFGQSITADVEFSNRRDLYDLLKHLGVDKTYVMGLSRGGQIALDFTLEHPELVDALMVVAGGIGGYQPGATEAEMAIFGQMEAIWQEAEQSGDFSKLAELEADVWADGPGQPKKRSGKVYEDISRMVKQNHEANKNEGKPQVLDPPAVGRLDEVRVPTLVMVGDLDFSGTQESMKKLAAEVKGAKFVEVPGVAHMVNMERPEEFNRVVLDFLDSVGE
jgi:pimeloyl-ACP methyl ester carboxylesterase